ncbi:hypothetical protein Tco_0003497 [Tanacetum coccineum]
MTKASLRSPTLPLVGFSGQVLWPLGVITAPFTFPDYTGKGSKAITTDFMIVQALSPYNLVRIGASLLTRIKQELWRILCKNKDIFAWSPFNMTGIPKELAEHKLNIHPRTFLICQKKHILAKDQNEAITTEVTKHVEVRILKEVYFPRWVANPVMVQKNDGTWRMCIDFTNLNKACLKDNYPLPEIDQKIESLDGFKYKCFLDAYKGYHLIRMTEEDEEKMAFYTKHGPFYYEKMHFGLKNVRETYQQLVEKAFSSQIGQNIEIYVDDTDNTGGVEPQRKTSCSGPIPSKVSRESALFFKTLKGCIEKINFQWSQEAEEAFQKVKLHLTENSGKLAKRAIELGEHDIFYKPRSAIKGQVITNFLAECPNNTFKKEPKEKDKITPKAHRRVPVWTLYTDGASINEGLELSIRLEIYHLQVFTDSLLVTNHVKGMYEAREESMK